MKFEPPINPYEEDGGFKPPQSFAYYDNNYETDLSNKIEDFVNEF